MLLNVVYKWTKSPNFARKDPFVVMIFPAVEMLYMTGKEPNVCEHAHTDKRLGEFRP